jgi:hypothetical protein
LRGCGAHTHIITVIQRAAEARAAPAGASFSSGHTGLTVAAAESPAAYARLLPAPNPDDLRALRAAAAVWAAENHGSTESDDEAATALEWELWWAQANEEEYWRPPPITPRTQRDAVGEGVAVPARPVGLRPKSSERTDQSGVEMMLAVAAAAVAVIVSNNLFLNPTRSHPIALNI